MEQKIYKYFENLSKNNKISQSFIIGNVFFDDIKDELNKTIKDFIFKNKKDVELNPDVFILNNLEESIRREDIDDLLKKISLTSQFNNKKVYIIDKFETLNATCYNAILKTLEEPSKDVYAFLITNNIDNINPTILSRCEKIFINSSSDLIINEKYSEIAKELVDSIEKYGVKTIGKNSSMYSKIKNSDKTKEKEIFNGIVNNMLLIYNKALDNILNDNKEDDIIYSNNTLETIAKKILIINDSINCINYSLNKSISLDRLIIEIWRCNNENSRS